MQELRQKIERTQAQIDAIHDERGTNIEMQWEIDTLKTLKNNYQNTYEKLKKDVAGLEKQAKNKEKAQVDVHRFSEKVAAKESKRNTLEERLNSTKP